MNKRIIVYEKNVCNLHIAIFCRSEMADAGDIIYRSIVVVMFIILMSSFLALLEHFIGKIIR